ncbi:hypothetical protein VB005_10657 [Metarhizium brunneum]
MERLVTEDCAILIGGIDGYIFAGKGLGISDIGSHLIAKNIPDKTAWLGFDIHFPFGENNEENGFGICYRWSDSQGIAVPAETYTITVKFPRHNVVRAIRPADDFTRSRFPDEKRELNLVEVILKDGAQVIVEGYGMPYANRGHIADKWLHENTPIINDVTLTGLLAQRNYYFIVASENNKLSQDWNFDVLPRPFRYPYGTSHNWKSESEYYEMLEENKGQQFFPRTSFDDINELLTVLSQSQIQDIMWVQEDAEKMERTKLPVYFVQANDDLDPEKDQLLYAIVALPPYFRTNFESSWRRLSREGKLKISVNDMTTSRYEARPKDDPWDAVIVDTSSIKHIDVLEAHPIKAHELVLYIRRTPLRGNSRFKIAEFRDRSSADDAFENSKEQ